MPDILYVKEEILYVSTEAWSFVPTPLLMSNPWSKYTIPAFVRKFFEMVLLYFYLDISECIEGPNFKHLWCQLIHLM